MVSDSFWGLVLVAVVAGVILAALGRIWGHRSQLPALVGQVKSGFEGRRRNKVETEHADLVRNVRLRASTLGIEVVDRVDGWSPTVVTYHPTGRQVFLFPDFPTFRDALEARQTDPIRSHFGKPPAAIDEWGVEELRNWLDRHRHETPDS